MKKKFFIIIYLVVVGIAYSMSTVSALASAAILMADSEQENELVLDFRSEVRIKVVSSIKEPDNQPIFVSTDIEEEFLSEVVSLTEEFKKLELAVANVAEVVPLSAEPDSVFTVPFYSQFSDITSPSWQKVGCGIASIAMLISFYEEEEVSVDGLLNKGIAANAFLSNAGWIHSGLIDLTREYGLNGESLSFAHLSMGAAFAELTAELEEGPVIASVRYKFEPTNPIPHLVVVNGVHNGKVFYNDPAEEVGGGSISIKKFKTAWKQRHIKIRPV